MPKKTLKRITRTGGQQKRAKKNTLGQSCRRKQPMLRRQAIRAQSANITPTFITIRKTTRGRAERLRERVAAEFPHAKLGRWHDELVGPHSQSMYQIAFPSGMLAAFLPWLMLNRDGLTVLLHPETGNDYRDHTAHAAWLGAVLPLRLEVFGEQRPDE